MVLASLSEGTYGGADTYQHYVISRYALTHPHLLFHHWGKPVFTLASAPFSQVGLRGMIFFNIVIAVLSAAGAAQISKRLGYQRWETAVVFVFLSPIYFSHTISGLTEYLFGFVLISAIVAVLNNRIYLSAIILSFLPFVRSEAVIILPLFGVVYVTKRKPWAGLLLLTGTLSYTVAGGLVLGDFLWLVHDFPYMGARDIYGSGWLGHYLWNLGWIWGYPISGFVFLGCLSFVKDVRALRRLDFTRAVEIFLIDGVAAVYFLGHSLAWYMGVGSSLGLLRYMIGIVPLTAIVCVRGLHLLEGWVAGTRVVRPLMYVIMSVVALGNLWLAYPVPVPLGKEQQIAVQVATSLNEFLRDERVCYFDPIFSYLLDQDPYEEHGQGVFLLDQHVAERAQIASDGPIWDQLSCDYLIWDAHFGANEGYTRLEELLHHSEFELKERFRPSEPFRTLGDQSYAVYLFKKR